MIDGRKIIGICLTRINEQTRAEYAGAVRDAAEALGYRVIVFNSLVDFYFDDIYDEGAKQIYEMINFDIIDGLIIFDETIHNKDIIKEIIRKAKQNKTPVITVNAKYEGCYSLCRNYDDAYTYVIDHIIKEHGVRDTVFIGGRKGDEHTEKRLNCYKKALKDNGLQFIEEMVGYGEYWNDPTIAELERIFAFIPKPPQAIICANDSMAMAAIAFLSKRGLRVPEDVIVTGFDGISEASHYNPKITTCREDIKKMAELCCDLINEAFEKNEPREEFYPYEPVITESCGCENKDDMYTTDEIATLYRQIADMHTHEDFMHNQVNRLIEFTDRKELFAALSNSSSVTYPCSMPSSAREQTSL